MSEPRSHAPAPAGLRILPVLLLAWSLPPALSQPMEYPPTRKIPHADEYHGTRVEDPYRWLEEDVRESPEVRAWVEAQNRLSSAHLESLAHREPIRSLIARLWDYERYSPPFRRGRWRYYWKNDGLQNQEVLYRHAVAGGAPELVIDPNLWSGDGTLALGSVSLSPEGRYLAYSVQDGGSDWRTWRVMETGSKRILEDEIRWVKFSGVGWTADGRGFFYSRYPAPDPDQAFQSLNKDQKVYYHRVGSPQESDTLVYQRPDQPDWGFLPEVTEDGRYLVLTVWKGTDDRYRVLYRDLEDPYAMPADLVGHFDNEYTFLGNEGPLFYFKTDLEAPNRRVVGIDIRRPGEILEIVPEREEALQEARIVGDALIAGYLRHASSRVRLHDLDGALVRELELPGIGTAGGFTGRRGDSETFYSFASFGTPSTVYRYDLLSQEGGIHRRPQAAFDPEDYEVEQRFCRSRDGARVPFFVARRKDVRPDGDLPVLLYGYGGFNISLPPRFSIGNLAWMSMGGAYVQANLRGGGEYGKEWHQAGTRHRKQNVFDDFIAVAEWLIANGYTRPGRLAIRGGSNGGLLVAACMNQRPDLFGACLPAVGVMDMLRFQKFTAGRFWVDDYGSSDDPEDFRALLAYSPYHNLQPGTAYPPTLVTTADTDDRVVPGHSFKYAARLQEFQGGEAPALIRIETRAGHGAGKPTSMIIDELADQWAFLVHHLDFEPRLAPGP